MDTLPLFPLYVAFLVALLGSAFFSSIEAAFLSVQRYKIKSAAGRGAPGAQRAAKLADHPESFLPTVLVGNNLANTVAATVGTLIAVQLISNETVGAAAAAVVVAIALIVFGEMLPKTLAARNAELAVVALSAPLIWMERALAPVVYPLQKLNLWVTRRFNAGSATSLVTQEELKVLISLNRESGGIDDTQATLLLHTLRLTDLQVHEVMTPRTEVVSVPDDMTVTQFLDFNARQYHSRFPVITRGIDDIVGILAAKEVFRSMSAGEITPGDAVARLAVPAHFIWESKPVVEAIAEMQRESLDMAIVVDEFGALEGLVTFHHLLVQVIGHARQPARSVGLDGGSRTFSLKGSTRLYEASEGLGLELPDGEYDTVGGFVISRLGRLPQPGDTVEHGPWILEVAKMAGPRIVELKVTDRRVPDPAPGT